MARFSKTRDTFFDVTAKDAIDVVQHDTKKTLEAREEDAEFIRRLRANQGVSFGARDWDQEARFDRTAERQAKVGDQEERERKRKKVSINASKCC